MGNNKIFQALSSNTRLNILKVLQNKEIHLSELSRKLGISVPVMSRHIKILENAGLINKRIIGNIHLLSTNLERLEQSLKPFIDESIVEINQNSSLLDALKQLPGVEIQKVGKNQYITSMDGEKGYYIYEVDGKPPNIPIDEYKPKKNITLQLKKLVPVEKKKIKIKIK